MSWVGSVCQAAVFRFLKPGKTMNNSPQIYMILILSIQWTISETIEGDFGRFNPLIPQTHYLKGIIL